MQSETHLISSWIAADQKALQQLEVPRSAGVHPPAWSAEWWMLRTQAVATYYRFAAPHITRLGPRNCPPRRPVATRLGGLGLFAHVRRARVD